MEEVHRISALGAKARRDLIGDPHRPITEGMDLAVRAQAHRDGTAQQLAPSHLDTTAQRGAIDPCGTAVDVGQTQLGLLPQQPLALTTIRAIRVDLHQRHHAAVDLRNDGRRPRLGRPHRLVLAAHAQRVGMPFGHLPDRARRQHHPIVFLQLAGCLRKRQIRPQIRHDPLQWQRAATVAHLGTLRKWTPSARPLPV